jgi:RNA-directed DNA polymerase
MDDKSLLFKVDNVIARMLIDSKVFKKRPADLKKLVRTYFEIKYNDGGNYIVDYDKMITILQKRQFLLLRGRINSTTAYDDDELEAIFQKYKNKNLKELEEELGYKYF